MAVHSLYANWFDLYPNSYKIGIFCRKIVKKKAPNLRSRLLQLFARSIYFLDFFLAVFFLATFFFAVFFLAILCSSIVSILV